MSCGRFNELVERGRPGVLARKKLLSYNTPRVVDADIAQLVEHQLPKLRVAGSNPVVRSSQ